MTLKWATEKSGAFELTCEQHFTLEYVAVTDKDRDKAISAHASGDALIFPQDYYHIPGIEGLKVAHDELHSLGVRGRTGSLAQSRISGALAAGITSALESVIPESLKHHAHATVVASKIRFESGVLIVPAKIKFPSTLGKEAQTHAEAALADFSKTGLRNPQVVAATATTLIAAGM